MEYDYRMGDNVFKVRLETSEYTNNGRLAVILMDDEGVFAKLTVNIPEAHCPIDCAYLDTNNLRDAERFVTENGLAEPIYESARSGFCTYPLYRFNMERLEG